MKNEDGTKKGLENVIMLTQLGGYVILPLLLTLQFGNSFIHYRITVNTYGIQFTIQVVTVQHHIIINSEKIDMKKGGLSVMIPGTHAMHLLQNRLHTILIHLYILTNHIDPNIKEILNPLM